MFWYSLVKTSRLKELESEYKKEFYLYASSFDKRATDKQLKDPKNNIFPNWITHDMVKEWIIDRKQNKMVLILK